MKWNSNGRTVNVEQSMWNSQCKTVKWNSNGRTLTVKVEQRSGTVMLQPGR